MSISHKFEYATDEDYWEPMYNYCFYAHRCLFEIENNKLNIEGEHIIFNKLRYIVDESLKKNK